jgi:hypothetical protein
MVGQSVENKPVLNFNLVLLTMDTHLNSAAKRAQARLQKNIPGVSHQKANKLIIFHTILKKIDLSQKKQKKYPQ